MTEFHDDQRRPLSIERSSFIVVMDPFEPLFPPSSTRRKTINQCNQQQSTQRDPLTQRHVIGHSREK
jgi:hypothetical protein